MDNSSGASPGRLIDEDESDILESAIDLFSLLSFVLIAAASLFGAAESQRRQTYSSVLSFDRVVQSDQVPTVPRGAVVVVLSGADSRVELRLRSADAQAKVLWSGSRLDALRQALEDELETFVNAETVVWRSDHSFSACLAESAQKIPGKNCARLRNLPLRDQARRGLLRHLGSGPSSFQEQLFEGLDGLTGHIARHLRVQQAAKHSGKFGCRDGL